MGADAHDHQDFRLDGARFILRIGRRELFGMTRRFRVRQFAIEARQVLELLQAPLLLFVWGPSRVVPVRLTEFSITEEAFDPLLNPIRAKVGLGLRVLTVDDLGFAHRGGSLFMTYLQTKERLAAALPAGALSALGLGGL